MLRIAFGLGSLGVGGSELNAIRTLEVLAREPEVSLSVFVMGGGELMGRLRAIGIPVHTLNVRRLWGPSAFAEGLSLVRQLRANRIQLLHTQDVYSNVFCVPWARLARVPVLVSSRRWDVYSPRRGIAFADRVASWLAYRTTANSESVAGALRREYHLPERRIAVFPNFLPPEAFRETDRVALRARLGLLGVPEHATILGSVARLRPVKDLATLIRAAKVLCEEREDLHVVIVGDGPEKDALLSLVVQLGLGTRVHFVGTQPNLPNINQIFSVAVLTSLTEGSPNVLIEAMAVGVPVVATSVGGSEALLRESRAGLPISPGDPGALADAVRRVLNDADLARDLGQAGREYTQQTHNQQEVVSRLLGWYRGLIAESVD